jgi:hypothetical protein
VLGTTGILVPSFIAPEGVLTVFNPVLFIVEVCAMLSVVVVLLLLALRAPSEGLDGFDDEDDEYLLGRCCWMQFIMGFETAVAVAVSIAGRWATATLQARGASAMRQRVNMVAI